MLTRITTAILITAMAPNLARAGLVIVRDVKPFSCAGMGAGGGTWGAGECDTDGDGLIIFTVPQNIQESAGAFTVCKTLWDAG